jgi:hypothetical protein
VVLHVLDSGGRPLAEAGAEAFLDGGGAVYLRADDAGLAHFQSLPPGRFSIAVSAPGFVRHEDTVTMDEADRELTITLRRE